ncbi:DUF1801 domain-containing protein [Chachezhania antarctica]|uniref:DUF1801 domain-containing protein n=1 Tax=Chachezhania antarctica TaxID=2340860 RepID=UPI000EB3DC44|nr:DUF1801 domain-containing protein [Chachezhania antarctica]|tara:strand:+ start:1552 stop:1992 length:441 start_codon:yes stop_codon:yes gene_type:complete
MSLQTSLLAPPRGQPPFHSSAVADAFASMPEAARAGLLALRGLIFEVAAETEGVGPLEETLKWGQPAYLTKATKAGSTIRLGVPKQGGFAVYVHCQTTILSDFRDVFPDGFDYEGNRAVRFPEGTAPPLDALRLLVRSALTYRLHK